MCFHLYFTCASSRNLSGWAGSQAGRICAAPDVGTGVGDPPICTRQGRNVFAYQCQVTHQFFPQFFPTWNTCACKDKHRIHLIPVSALCLLRKVLDPLLLSTFYLAFQHPFFPHHQADQLLLLLSIVTPCWKMDPSPWGSSINPISSTAGKVGFVLVLEMFRRM